MEKGVLGCGECLHAKKKKKFALQAYRSEFNSPNMCKRNLNLVAHIYDSSTGKAETNGFLELPGLPA